MRPGRATFLQNCVQNASNPPLPKNAKTPTNEVSSGLTRTLGINARTHRYHSPPPPQPPVLLPSVVYFPGQGWHERSGAERGGPAIFLSTTSRPAVEQKHNASNERTTDGRTLPPREHGGHIQQTRKSVSWIYPDHRITAAPQLRPAPNPAHAMTSPDFTCFGGRGGGWGVAKKKKNGEDLRAVQARQNKYPAQKKVRVRGGELASCMTTRWACS